MVLVKQKIGVRELFFVIIASNFNIRDRLFICGYSAAVELKEIPISFRAPNAK
jgi:hypothetical protein